MSDLFDDMNRHFNFTIIQGYPHDIPEKAIEEFPIFQWNMMQEYR